MRIACKFEGTTELVLESCGRTEDVQFSPRGNRLAVAGYSTSTLFIATFRSEDSRTGLEVSLSDGFLVRCQAFSLPHGLTWVDDQTIIVANREGAVVTVSIPETAPASGEVVVDAMSNLSDSAADIVQMPGAVAAFALGDGLVDVLVCNNSANTVSRHLVDGSDRYRPLVGSIALDGFKVPDGIAIDTGYNWVAVSSHYDHEVQLFSAGVARLGGAPDGRLKDVGYPHGIRFSKLRHFIVAADAGAPFVSLYVSDDGEWRGPRTPVARMRVMDDQTFQRGAVSPEEGGPKGLDVSRDETILVVSCEEAPLAFFDLRPFTSDLPLRVQVKSDTEVLPLRRRMLVEHALSAQATITASRAETAALRKNALAHNDELEQARLAAGEEISAALDTIKRSRSWRLTMPLRTIAELLHRRTP